MQTIKSNIMTNIINYLTEGYKGFFVTAGTGSSTLLMGVFKVENIDYIVSCLQVFALIVTIAVGLITIYSKLKRKKDKKY